MQDDINADGDPKGSSESTAPTSETLGTDSSSSKAKAPAPPGGGSTDVTASSEEGDAEPEIGPTFAELGIAEDILRGLTEMGYERPTKVQSAVFAHVREKRDLLVQSRTGTGKTAAFGIPVLAGIDPDVASVQALVLAPTRELANQVAAEFRRICQFRDTKILPIYGGAPINPQIKAFEDGAQVVCGTPGRVLDHIRRGTMKTDKLRMLVFDEADEMLSMGFAEEIEAIVSELPDTSVRQTVLFSATIPDDIERIANKHMKEPVKVSLSSDGVSVDSIDHFYYVVSGMARTRDLLKVLLVEEPESAIIFCNTRDDTNTVARFLNKNGHDAEPISSDLTQKDRERVMKRMRDKNLKYLCATDIAARGIDISQLSHVINYTFPESPEVYVHRTGRTGRAGKDGTAISLIGPREIGAFYFLKLIYKIRPTERDLPSKEELFKMQEGEHYQKVVSLVPEAPGEHYISLAKKLWDSDDGERVVGALLERLLTAKPPRKTPPKPRSSEEQSARSSNENGDGKSSADSDRDKRSTRSNRDRDGDEEKGNGRRRKRRTRGERGGDRERSPRRDSSESSPRTSSASSKEAVKQIDPDEDTIPLREDENLALDHEKENDDAPKRKRRRRRRSRDSRESTSNARSSNSNRNSSASSDSSDDDGEPKEFWEAWADENKSESNDDDAPRAEAKSEESRPRKTRRSRSGEERSGEKASPTTTRLYINIGKREEASADDVRGLVEEALADKASEIGSVAIRNTHSYVRVPNELVDKVIDSLAGKSFKERELVVERARR